MAPRRPAVAVAPARSGAASAPPARRARAPKPVERKAVKRAVEKEEDKEADGEMTIGIADDVEDAEEEDVILLSAGVTEDALADAETADVADEDAVSKSEKRLADGMKQSAARAKAPKLPSGVVFVGHIPFGFFEKEMGSFFSQFGRIKRMRLSRNKKTGRPKNYAFLEFEHEDVAKIVAETMDKYLMHGRMLTCKFVPKDKVHKNTFRCSRRKFINIPWRKLAVEKKERSRTGENHARVLKRLVAGESKKRTLLKELGIDYKFNGYAEAVAAAAAKTKKPVSSVAKSAASTNGKPSKAAASAASTPAKAAPAAANPAKSAPAKAKSAETVPAKTISKAATPSAKMTKSAGTPSAKTISKPAATPSAKAAKPAAATPAAKVTKSVETPAAKTISAKMTPKTDVKAAKTAKAAAPTGVKSAPSTPAKAAKASATVAAAAGKAASAVKASAAVAKTGKAERTPVSKRK